MKRWTEADRRRCDEAFSNFDRRQVAASAAQFAEVIAERGGGDAWLEPAVALLRRLQHKGYVPVLLTLAESLLRSGLDRPPIRYLYALALLDQGRVAAAEAILLRMPPEIIRGDADVRSAIGRVHKARYLAGGSPLDLREAVRWYRSTYLDDPATNHYPGINAAAMLRLAAADGTHVEGFARPEAEARSLAAEILARIGPSADQWQLACAVEACLILDRDPFDWLNRYLSHPGVDAFEVNTTLRQFQLLHGLAPDVPPGRQVLPLLRARQLAASGGWVDLTADVVGSESMRAIDEVLEKNFSDDQFRTTRWLRTALTRCRAVARVETPTGVGVGTGFLLDGRDLAAGLPARVLLTNAHVVPDRLNPGECYASFLGVDDPSSRHPLGNVLWTSPVPDLDATLLELPVPPDESIVPLPVRTAGLIEPPVDRAFVIGYPGGRSDVAFSLHDTRLLDFDDRVAHYRTPTEGGSSGSPVFDDEWRVFALHHSGNFNVRKLNREVGRYDANEGILMSKIRASLAS
ncbi:hypothetical protein BJ973_001649 [Actinoplanes tereljensis]|uniref:Serine protease n=1 Tax=Paractinoplanes tereljensis TaxID=571912 RepID=A0A919NMB2_9ACTN|nr:trypsin-like peptidase domain-containing protein [Actinoplanes tereljensis]GIF20447.1 hypothetical protein Ate02nite_31770 [Actinoplanes tereljensis]